MLAHLKPKQFDLQNRKFSLYLILETEWRPKCIGLQMFGSNSNLETQFEKKGSPFETKAGRPLIETKSFGLN